MGRLQACDISDTYFDIIGTFNNLNFVLFLAYFIVCHTMVKNTFSKLLRSNSRK